MNSNLEKPVSKCLRTDINTKNENPISALNDLAGPASSASTDVTSEHVFDSGVNIFTDDILPQIFQNTDILTAEDLLNFRLVNRCWRDAATSVLLKHNLCQIELDFNKVIIGLDGVAVAQNKDVNKEDFSNDPSSYKFVHAYHPKNFVSDLSSVISASTKFPSNSIYFYEECCSGFGNLSKKSDSVNAHKHQLDLLNFLSLHGTKFKKLSLCSGISKKAVQNLLYVHMPYLTNLDISELYDFSDEDETWEGSQTPLCFPPPSVLAIKEMSVPYKSCDYPDWKVDFVKELISVSPNLSALRSVHTPLLGYLIAIGKFQLVKKLYIELIVHQMSTRDQLSKFLADTIWNGGVSNLKLSRLTIGWLDHGNYTDNCKLVVKVLNIILSSCKNYLEHLRIYMNPSDFLIHLFIPPLPHLKSLGLHDMEILRSPFNTKINFCGDVIGGALHDGGITADESVTDLVRITLQTQNINNIPVDYFPRLQQVDLNMREMRNDADKLMNFFALGHPRAEPSEEITLLCDTLPTVTKLKLDTFFGRLYKSEMQQLFPNVLHLEINCGFSDSLSNSFWSAFPKLETFKICGLNRRDDDDPNTNTNVIDSFFTGMSPELCSQFERDATCSVEPLPIFERTMPYIGDCKNLKEFRIQFARDLNSKFASKLTAAHGFGEVVYRTKIIFAFQSGGWSVEEKEETLRHVEPVSAFVQIQMES